MVTGDAAACGRVSAAPAPVIPGEPRAVASHVRTVIPGERVPLGSREGVRSGSVRTTQVSTPARCRYLGSLDLARTCRSVLAGNDNPRKIDEDRARRQGSYRGGGGGKVSEPKALDLILTINGPLMLAFMARELYRGAYRGWERKAPLSPITRQSAPTTFWALTIWIALGITGIAWGTVVAAVHLLNSN